MCVIEEKIYNYIFLFYYEETLDVYPRINKSGHLYKRCVEWGTGEMGIGKRTRLLKLYLFIDPLLFFLNEAHIYLHILKIISFKKVKLFKKDYRGKACPLFSGCYGSSWSVSLALVCH